MFYPEALELTSASSVSSHAWRPCTYPSADTASFIPGLGMLVTDPGAYQPDGVIGALREGCEVPEGSRHQLREF